MLSLACALPLCTVARCDSRCQAACKCHSSAKPAWVMTLSYPQIQGMGRKIQPCSKGSFQIPSSGKKNAEILYYKSNFCAGFLLKCKCLHNLIPVYELKSYFCVLYWHSYFKIMLQSIRKRCW